MTKRVVLCIGRNCNAQGVADAHFERLRAELGYPNPFNHPNGIKWEIANCLSHCEIGPNLAIYDEDGVRWCHHLNADTLEQVIADEIMPVLDAGG